MGTESHPSTRLTTPQRLRLAVAKVLGERRMLRLAEWLIDQHHTVTLDAYMDAMLEAHRLACDGWGKSDRKRRTLARRRLERRARRVPETTGTGTGASVWIDASNGPRNHHGVRGVCQPGSPYPPSGACVLTPSGTAPRNVEEQK